MTMDAKGRLFVGHASLGHVFVFAPNGELIARIKSCAGGACTNVAIGGEKRDRLYITESTTGTVLVADISVLDSNAEVGKRRGHLRSISGVSGILAHPLSDRKDAMRQQPFGKGGPQHP